MAGKLNITTLQVNDSATATNNFVLKADNAGGVKLSRGNDGATTQDILSVSSTGLVTLLFPPVVPAQSMVRLNTANGYGSTNTKIRRFTNVVTNQGSDITYADSATLGARFTINTNGVYAISYSDSGTGISQAVGLSLNSSQLTTDIFSINIGDILAQSYQSAANYWSLTAVTVYLASGSVVRPHTQGVAVGATASSCQFTITRVA